VCAPTAKDCLELLPCALRCSRKHSPGVLIELVLLFIRWVFSEGCVGGNGGSGTSEAFLELKSGLTTELVSVLNLTMFQRCARQSAMYNRQVAADNRALVILTRVRRTKAMVVVR
jgi:hypothetical protein